MVALEMPTAAALLVEVKGWLGFLSVVGLTLYPALLLLWNFLEGRCIKTGVQDGEGNCSDAAGKSVKHSANEVVDPETKGKREVTSKSCVEFLRKIWAFLVALSVWPCICLLPLALTCGGFLPGYADLFPASWYDEEQVRHTLGEYWIADVRTVKPLGLILGILAVVVGQVFVVVYHAMRRSSWLGGTTRVQQQVRQYSFGEGLATHLAQPEGFALIGGYLAGAWMLGWMPSSYYSFAGGISWKHVAAQLLLQDFIQCLMHFGEHKVSTWVYSRSHKPHHRFTNPRLFDAFNGSPTDTILMIIVPFVLVAHLVPANVWSYMTFGTLYANWLVLIHSEYAHPWDAAFRLLGLGTAADHHVHHKLFVYNYGHLFMYWDKILGTYRDPSQLAGKFFNKDV